MRHPDPAPTAETMATSAPVDPAWPSHLSSPSEGGWAIWRDFVVRSAGFPADLLQPLADPACGDSADRLDEARSRCEALAAEAIARVGARIDALRAGPAAEAAEAAPAGRDLLKQLQQVVRALRRGAVPEDLDAAIGAGWAGRLRAAHATRDSLAADHQRHLDASRAAFSALAARLAGDPLFREAVCWQNHAAVEMALDPLANGAPMPGSKRRQREALVTGYLQRYALKNDTIGFFGPMTWARIVPPGVPPLVRHGAGLLRRREVRFEDWPLATLAADMAADDRVLPWLVPRRPPFLSVQGTRLRLPGGASVDLPASEASLLAACDGVATAGEIARRLALDPFGDLESPDEALALLRKLEQDGRVHLGFPVSSGDPLPERALRRCIARVTDASLQATLSDRLGRFEAARDTIARAAGDAVRLPAALRALDDLFREECAGPARRRTGQAYGGRGLVYEDCHRDLDVRLDERALAPMRGALDFVLASSRWYIGEAARRFESRFAAIVGTHAPAAGALPLADFWLRAQGLLFGEEDVVSDLSDALRERWEQVLAPFVRDGARRVDVASRDLRAAMETAFPARAPGWNMARHQCPDLMFCAASGEALARGDYLAVLGEVHIGGNTLATNLFLSQHPEPASMLEALARDLGAPYVCPKLGPETSGTPIRTQFVEDPASCREVLFSHALVPANPATAFGVGDLDVVTGGDGRLAVRHAGSGWQAPLLDVLGDFLFLRVLNEFGVVRRRPHTPRITIDRLVVQRERWIFRACELAALAAPGDDEVLLAARRWARAQALPEQVFVKLAWEDKPFFVDFRGPALVQLLARQVRNVLADDPASDAAVSITEMLPAADELWLQDAAGRRFTSECRFVCLHQDDARVRAHGDRP